MVSPALALMARSKPVANNAEIANCKVSHRTHQFAKPIGMEQLRIVAVFLTVGDMKDTEPWQQTLPWMLSLTKREIGQI